MCKVDFQSINEMDNHMDDKHEGRWKKYDSDVIREGDKESDSSDEYSESDDSNRRKEESKWGSISDKRIAGKKGKCQV